MTIPCIPIGAAVTVKESGNEGFLVFTRLDGVDEAQISGADRALNFSNIPQTLHFINQSGFRLPNTGGSGMFLYAAGGASLSTCMGAALLYRRFRRERRK